MLKHVTSRNRNQLEFRFSRGILFFLIPFTLFWSGGSMTGIYIVLLGSTPGPDENRFTTGLRGPLETFRSSWISLGTSRELQSCC